MTMKIRRFNVNILNEHIEKESRVPYTQVKSKATYFKAKINNLVNAPKTKPNYTLLSA